MQQIYFLQQPKDFDSHYFFLSLVIVLTQLGLLMLKIKIEFAFLFYGFFPYFLFTILLIYL